MRTAPEPKFQVSLAWVLALALVGGCGSGSPSSDSPVPADLNDHDPAEHVSPPPQLGELRLRSNEIHSSEFRWYCDDAVKSYREEITEELDRRADWLIAGMAENSSDQSHSDYRRESFGESFPVWMRDSRKENRPDEWLMGPSTTWVALYGNFIALRELGDEGSWQQWYYLAKKARSLLADDLDRVVDGKNFSLDHRAIEHFPEFRDSFSRCLSDPDCVFPRFSEAVSAWARGISWYRLKLNDIELLRDNPEEARRQMARYLQTRLAIDSSRVQMRTLNHVRRASRSTWVVRLSSSGIEPIRKFIGEVIEDAWHSSRYRVKVEWVDDPAAQAGLPRFVLRSEPGERDYVSWGENDGGIQIHLFPDTNSDSIQHEIGHILGFRDQYFTLFSTQYCGYATETNEADIMSHHVKGRVLPSHWRQLNTAYPYRGR